MMTATRNTTSSQTITQRCSQIPQPRSHPFFTLPSELQTMLLVYLPYNSLIALRLTSKHFSQNIIPYGTLLRFRRAWIRKFLTEEQAALKHLLTIPDTRPRWFRFWHQDTCLNEDLFERLESYLRGQSDEPALSLCHIFALKATEHLRCYSCLELKSTMAGAEFVGQMSTRSHGLGGSRAASRMCKQCMLRKNVGDFYGRWWKEADTRMRDVVMIKDGAISKLVASHYADGEQPTDQRTTERGVCSQCRLQSYGTWWGCPGCYEIWCKNREAKVESYLSNRRDRVRYDLSMRFIRHRKWWQDYTGTSCRRPTWHLIFHPRQYEPKRICNVLGGQSLWQYRRLHKWNRAGRRRSRTTQPPADRKDAAALAEAAALVAQFDQYVDTTRSEWKPYAGFSTRPAGARHWEIRCVRCWSTVRPSWVYSHVRWLDFTEAEEEAFWPIFCGGSRLETGDFCGDCRSAADRGKKARRARKAAKEDWQRGSREVVECCGDDDKSDRFNGFEGIQEMFREG